MMYKSHYALYPIDPAVLQQIDFAAVDAPPPCWKFTPLEEDQFFNVCAHNWITLQSDRVTLKDLALFDLILSYPRWIAFNHYSLSAICEGSSENLPWLRSLEQVISIYFQAPGAFIGKRTHKIFDYYTPSDLIKKHIPLIFKTLYRVLFWRIATLAPTLQSAPEEQIDPTVERLLSEAQTLGLCVALGSNRTLYANIKASNSNPVSLGVSPKHWRTHALFYQSAQEGPLPTLLASLCAYGSSYILQPLAETIQHQRELAFKNTPKEPTVVHQKISLSHNAFYQKVHPAFWSLAEQHPNASPFDLMLLHLLQLLPHVHFELQYNAGTFASLVRLACYRKNALLLQSLAQRNAHFHVEWFENMGTINANTLHPLFDAFNGSCTLTESFLQAGVDLLEVHEHQQEKKPHQKSLLLRAVSFLNAPAIRTFAPLDPKELFNAYLHLCSAFKESASYEASLLALHAYLETIDPARMPNLYATLGSIQLMSKNKALLRFLKSQKICFTHLTADKKQAMEHAHLIKEPIHSSAYRTLLEFLFLQSALMPFSQKRSTIPCLFSAKKIPLLHKNMNKSGSEEKKGGSKRL